LDPLLFLQLLLWATVSGSLYVLLATGLTLIFGILKIVNFAQGEFMIAGALLSLVLGRALGLNPYASLPLSALLVGLMGLAAYRLAFRAILGTTKLNEILVSIALILIIQNAIASYFVPTFREAVQLSSPFAGEGISLMGGLTLTYDLILVIVTSWLTLAALYTWLYRSRTGLSLRALSQNQVGAMLCGINVGALGEASFFVGVALAGLAGTLYGIITPFDPHSGTLLAVKAFAIIILTGLGNVGGAAIGGLLLALAENFVSATLGPAWKDAAAFILLTIVLAARPTGLLGERV
jgi:branched-chain amino acid transport system permease protein